MQKLIFLLCFLLVSCRCLIGQIPPQSVQLGPTCTAPLPNYLPYFTVAAGCTGYNLTQTPPAGTLLTTSNSPMNVIIRATSKTNGKFDQKIIVVTGIDTVTPKLTPTGILAYQAKQIQDIYDLGDKILGHYEKNIDNVFPYDSFPGMKPLVENDYFKKTLVTMSWNKSDSTRGRVITFWSPALADSVQKYLTNKYK